MLGRWLARTSPGHALPQSREMKSAQNVEQFESFWRLQWIDAVRSFARLSSEYLKTLLFAIQACARNERRYLISQLHSLRVTPE